MPRSFRKSPSVTIMGNLTITGSAIRRRAEDPAAWERFLKFHRGQLQELCTRYQPDLLWFDGDWERDPEQWRFAELREQLHGLAPGGGSQQPHGRLRRLWHARAGDSRRPSRRVRGSFA